MYRVMERSGLLDGAGIGTYASYSRSEKDVRTDKFWDELRDPRSRLDRRLIVFGGGGFVTVVAIGILWMQAVGPAMVAAAA
ncbi:MAG: hypothetical protein JWQ89_798 [Devosia sp.]|nr:hypothetical protein [Devosia sp.]